MLECRSTMMNFLKHLAPNLVTAIALVCGIAAIHAAVTGRPVDGTWWVLWAIVFDKLDGAVARKLKVTSALGAQFDSFSDFTSFGLAPFFVFAGAFGHAANALTVFLGLVFVFGCVLRLAKYNLTGSDNTFFRGVPTPMAAGISCLALNLGLKYAGTVDSYALVYSVLLAIFGILMNLPWLTYQKVGTENTLAMRLFVVVTIFVCFVLMLLRMFPEFLLCVSTAMLIFGPLLRPLTDSRPTESTQ